MTDNMSVEQRSLRMGKVLSSGNRSTELKLMRILKEEKIHGWRRNQSILGKPDFLFRSKRVAVFVDGCFWHGCPKCYRRPKSNQEFWDRKVRTNRARDRQVKRELESRGWKVVRFWEHELKHQGRVVAKLRRALVQSSSDV
ncbi:MAG: DNA mismatch endonuclease Vsr [Verrucomicrobiae bacterium]|nr:DNA mismatch endonuclease Vsr [Verrucomicrobiae bacterium]